MSTQSTTAAKPSLQGVRIKARKGAVKAHAKHEPAVFRDQLYKQIESVPEGDFDGYVNKLVQAGGTLEYLKYADSLFEILFVGGLVQPGGSYVEDGAPPSPFSLFKAKEPVEIDDVKKYVDVFNKLIRRYKYLQRPLEDSSLPTLLQYVHRWTAEEKEKIAIATGLLISMGLANPTCLQSLTKDHLVKNDVSMNTITLVFRAYLAEQSMDHLAATLRKGGIRDLLLFFPPNKRNTTSLEAHFRTAGLPQVAEWWSKKQYAALKEELATEIKEHLEKEDDDDEMIASIKAKQNEQPLPDTELMHCVWQTLMTSVDWSSARPDQIEGLALREVTRFAPILEAFTNGAKTEVALINAVQQYCYDDTRLMKTFQQILKVLYNKDCISDQAIIYWHQKGSKPQGRQHFLKATETLVKYLQDQEDEDSDE